MMVTLTARSPCWLCGYQFKVIRISSVRINKRSLREHGTSIVAVGPVAAKGFPLPHGKCPECGERDTAGSIPVSAYRLSPEDGRAVAEYRARRWPG